MPRAESQQLGPESAPPPRLETERLILRVPVPSDAGDVYETHRHSSVADGVISVPHPCPAGHGLAWIEQIRRAMSGSHLFVWVLECRAQGRVIGDCGLDITPAHLRGSIGYILHPDRQGSGLMTEALDAVIRYAFRDRDPALERIEADIYPGNAASFRLCDRLGFRTEGTLRNYIRKDGTQRDAVRVGLTRVDYFDLSARED